MALKDLLKVKLVSDAQAYEIMTGLEDVQQICSLIAAAGPLPPSLGTGSNVSGKVLAAIYQDDDAHDTCTLTACLNPLHPGPCKGWKGILHETSPGAWHALEAARVEKANHTRIKKIEALKAQGKPIPHKLLQPILPKAHPNAGQTAAKATGEAHEAGKAVTESAGIHNNHPGKVTLGQAIKPIPQDTGEKGPKGKKPTVMSKGIAFVIAQEKVTPQYKLDKAAAITPEQWKGLSEADQSSIRGELAKIKIDGFGPQQKKADELLAKLPAGAQPGGPIPPAVEQAIANSPMNQKVQAVKAEVVKGSTLAEAIKKVTEHQEANAAFHKQQAEAVKAPLKLPEPEAPKGAPEKLGTGLAADLTATHNGHEYTKKTAVDYTHISVTHVPGSDKPIISWHKSEAAALKGNLTPEQKKNGFHVKAVAPVTKAEAPKTVKVAATHIKAGDTVTVKGKTMTVGATLYEGQYTKPGAKKMTNMVGLEPVGSTSKNDVVWVAAHVKVDKHGAPEGKPSFADQVELGAPGSGAAPGKVGVADVKVGDVVKGNLIGGDHTVAKITNPSTTLKNTHVTYEFHDADGKTFFVGNKNAKATIGKGAATEAPKAATPNPPPLAASEGASMTPGHLGNLIHKQGGSADVTIGGKKITVGFEGGNHEAKLTFKPGLGTGTGGYTITTKDGEKYQIGKGESVTVHPKTPETKAAETPKLAPEEKPKPLPKHVTDAIAMAEGKAPGATWSKNHLAAYQSLTAEEYKALPPDVQDKIVAELVKGQSKFLDPKKVQASKDLIEKFKGPPAAPKAEPVTMDNLPVGFVKDLHNHAVSDAEAKKVVAQTPIGTQFLAAKQIAGLTQKDNPDATHLHADAADTAASGLVQKHTAIYTGPVLKDPAVTEAKKALFKAAWDQAHAESVLEAKQKAFSKIAMKTKGDHGLSPMEKATLVSVGAHMLEHLTPDTSVSTMDKLKADTKSAEQELDVALHAALKKANSPAPQAPSAPDGELPEYDKDLIQSAFSEAWSKAASKAVVYGLKSYTEKSKMKAHPDYEALTHDLGQLRTQSGVLALTHAKVKRAQEAVPTDPDTGALDKSSPEYQKLTAALDERAQAQDIFNQLHKNAQVKLNTVRASVGLTKRALPKLDAPAVKAAAAETAFYKTAGYGAPLYGKAASAKQYMLAKVGPGLGVAHKSSSEKAAEKVAKVAEKAAPMPAPKVHVKPPSSEAGKSPNPDTAASLGYHYTPKVADDPHGQGWPGTGAAYVSSPEQLSSLQEHLAKPDTKFGIEAQKQFKWSVNNMEGKGATSAGKSALYAYTGGSYTSINEKLNSLPPGAKSPGGQISSIDAAFAAAPPLEGDVVLYRGFQSPTTVFSSGKWNDVNVAGVEWTQRSYSSTSGSLSTAQNFAGGSGVVMRVIIPKEMQVKGINAKGGQHPGENEIILQRGLRYRVVADHGKHGNRRYIDVMVVPSPYDKPE